MTDLQMLGHSANLAWYRRSKDLVPLIDPKVQLFENSLLKILAQLQCRLRITKNPGEGMTNDKPQNSYSFS